MINPRFETCFSIKKKVKAFKTDVMLQSLCLGLTYRYKGHYKSNRMSNNINRSGLGMHRLLCNHHLCIVFKQTYIAKSVMKDII